MREQRRTGHTVSILMVHIVWVTKIEKEILGQAFLGYRVWSLVYR